MKNNDQLLRLKIWLALLLTLSGTPAVARFIGPFEAHQSLHQSSIVCKVRVRTVSTTGTATEPGRSRSATYDRSVAVCDVLSVLKGACPARITIEYPDGRSDGIEINGPILTVFSEGDVRLVFLDRKGDRVVSFESTALLPTPSPPEEDRSLFRGSYVFHDPDHSSLPATPAAFVAGVKASPEDRLLNELIANARSSDPELVDAGFSQLAAWCQSQARDYQPPPTAGIIFRPEVQALLSDALSSKDTLRRGLAAWTSVQAGVSPGAGKAASALLSTDKLPRADWGLVAGRMTSGSAQGCLVDALDSSTRHFARRPASVIQKRTGPVPRGIDGFDYATFCHLALGSEAARSSTEIRKGIANIIWIMEDERNIPDAVTLLDDANPYIRSCGVGALQKIVHHKQPELSYEEALRQQPEDIRTWKEWWATSQRTHTQTSRREEPRQGT